MNVTKILFMIFWFPAALAGTCLLIDWAIPGAHAEELRCTNGFVAKNVERICDNQLANVCYVTHENGHGIEMMSCTKQ